MALAAFVGLVLVAGVTYALVSRSLLDQVDETLERAHSPIEEQSSRVDRQLVERLRAVAPSSFIEIRDQSGATVVTLPLRRPGEPEIYADLGDLPGPGSFGDDGAVFASVDSLDSDDHMRIRVSNQDDGGTLVIGESLASVSRTQNRLVVVLAAATGFAVLVIALIGNWLVRVGLRPLDAVERTARTITESDLDQRVPGDDRNTEVGRLAHTINGMLDRLRSAMAEREHDLESVRASEERMRRFVADASHELRTPIAATSAYAELFERGARDNPADLERTMRGIRSESARMAALVDDLLLLSRLDSEPSIEHQPVDLTHLAIDAVEAARLIAAEFAIETRTAGSVMVLGDPSRLRRVLDNLLANVRTHTPSTTRTVVEVTVDGDEAVVQVTDDGPGLTAEEAALAFDRFYRGDPSRSRQTGGSGLGLAIVDALVRAHDGTTQIESAPGTGVRVTVRLPQLRSNDGPSEEVQP
jgi:two-component system OmpR family sensor kinase